MKFIKQSDAAWRKSATRISLSMTIHTALKWVKIMQIGAIVLKMLQLNAVASLDFVSEKPCCRVVDINARWHHFVL